MYISIKFLLISHRLYSNCSLTYTNSWQHSSISPVSIVLRFSTQLYFRPVTPLYFDLVTPAYYHQVRICTSVQ